MLQWTVGFTAAAAVFDLLRALPAGTLSALRLTGAVAWADRWFPLAAQGFGWLCPALLGLAVGLVLQRLKKPA